MTAGHEFERGTNPVQLNQRRALVWALGVNAVFLIVEVVGGIVFGSLALIADAAHLLSDVAGLGIALAGLTLADRPISTRHSFGFARAEVMAAQLSALLVHRAQGESLNMRASFVHLATDAAGSLGAIIAGLVILGTGSHACIDAMMGKARAAGIDKDKILETFKIARFAEATRVMGNGEPLLDQLATW